MLFRSGHRLAGTNVSLMPDFGKTGNSSFALVGNPFMTTIDFDRLRMQNFNLIKGSYHVWMIVDGQEGYVCYNPYGNFGILSETQIDNLIAPLQGFVVEQVEEPEPDLLNFNLIGISSRILLSYSEQARNNKIEIIAKNDKASVLTFISMRDEGSVQIGRAHV